MHSGVTLAALSTFILTVAGALSTVPAKQQDGPTSPVRKQKRSSELTPEPQAGVEDVNTSINLSTNQYNCEARTVFSVGLPRTGTTSLADHLIRLGFDGGQGIDNMPTPQEVQDCMSGKCDFYKNLGAGNNSQRSSFAAVPTFGLACSLITQFPDAKFILSTRPVDQYLDSALHMLCHYIKPMCAEVGVTHHMKSQELLYGIGRPFQDFCTAERTRPAMCESNGSSNAAKEEWQVSGLREQWRMIDTNHVEQVQKCVPQKQLSIVQLGNGDESAKIHEFLGCQGNVPELLHAEGTQPVQNASAADELLAAPTESSMPDTSSGTAVVAETGVRKEPKAEAATAEFIAAMPFAADDAEAAFLPMTVGGVQVLVNNGGNDWMVDNTRLKSNAEGLGYRRSKRLDDKDDNRFMSWGTVVKGIDTGDGWLQVKVTKAPTTKTETAPAATSPAQEETKADTVGVQQEATVGKHEARTYSESLGALADWWRLWLYFCGACIIVAVVAVAVMLAVKARDNWSFKTGEILKINWSKFVPSGRLWGNKDHDGIASGKNFDVRGSVPGRLSSARKNWPPNDQLIAQKKP